ncbi:MAG: outer membrane beta-barrel protein [Verrucomicrobiales bacterium]|nr:outer membrane beta-barrel protein [Verrucomicrobiales bacterium]
MGRNSRRSVAFLLLSLGTQLSSTAAEPTTNYLPLHPPRTDEVTPLLGNEHFGFYPRASATAGYDDNITLRPTNPADDFIWTFSPGFTLLAGESGNSLGNSTSIRGASLGAEDQKSGVANRGLLTTSKGLTIDYGAALRYFSKNSDQNAVDHAARINGVLPLERLKLHLFQDLQSLSDATIDFGTRTRRQQYITELGASYSLTERTSLQLDGYQAIHDYQTGIGSREWRGMGYANYTYSPTLTLGIGGGGGVLDPSSASSQSYTQVRVRVAYAVTEKVFLDASGGAEFRKLGDGLPHTRTPVFDMGLAYALSPQFQVRLSGGRRNQSSALYTRQNYADTSATLTLSYQPMERLAVYSAVDYHHLGYRSTGGGNPTTRRDDYLALRVGIGFELALRWSLGLYYQYRENSSADPLFEYANNQTGISLAWAY